MTATASTYARMIEASYVEGIELPVAYVKLFRQGADEPAAVQDRKVDQETLTVCQAIRYAALDQPVYLTRDTISCVAAAISLGMVDPEDRQPMASLLPA